MATLKERIRYRFPKPLAEATQFTGMDWWHYDPVEDSKLCDLCQFYDNIGTFNGVVLQPTFPYLKIIDENTIKVNAHEPRDPNCRCVLRRG